MTSSFRWLALLPVLAGLIQGCVTIPHPAAVATVRPDLRTRGEHALVRGDLAGARRIYAEMARPVEPRFWRGQGYLGLARCALRQGDLDSARAHALEADRLLVGSRHAAEASLLLGEIYGELGEWDRCQVQLEAAAPRLDGRNRRRACSLLALLHERAGRTEDAGRLSAFAGSERHPLYDRWRERIPAASPAPPPRAEVAPRVPSVVSRRQWAARATKPNVTRMRNVRRITIHHTGEPEHIEHENCDDCADYLRRLQVSSQRREMADIPYHYLIDARGTVYEGRPLYLQGAHGGNRWVNDGNIGIALIGNFEDAVPARPQLGSLRSLVRELRRRYGIDRDQVLSHRQLKERAGLPYTVCPGHNLERLLPHL